MTTRTAGAAGSPVVAACVALAGLLLLWLAQPVLPGWACAASLPGSCLPHVLPVRASAISAGILIALLGTAILLRVLPVRAGWTGSVSRGVMVAVPVVLALTVVAHFLIPQP
jgi:hypothetical protein